MSDLCQRQSNVARNIARNLRLQDLAQFCQMNKNCHLAICDNNGFWKSYFRKFNQDVVSEPRDWDWKEYYKKSLQLFYIIDENINRFTARGVTKISFGLQHYGYLTFDGDLYLLGSNEFGQLAMDSRSIKTWVKVATDVIWFLCSHKYTIYIDVNLNCYIAGLIERHTSLRLLEKDVIDAYINPGGNAEFYI